MKCKLCGSDAVVYSGTAAFLLGIPTEKYCYDCANNGAAQMKEKEGQ